MPLSGASIPVGATYSPTGGSATTFVSLGGTLGKKDLFLDDGSSLILRRLLSATSIAPRPLSSAPNGYTQQKVQLFMKVPKLLANGKYTTNTVDAVIRFDPETTTAERAFLREMLAHYGSDSDFAEFFEDGSVA